MAARRQAEVESAEWVVACLEVLRPAIDLEGPAREVEHVDSNPRRLVAADPGIEADPIRRSL